jgi:hypothetical protein
MVTQVMDSGVGDPGPESARNAAVGQYIPGILQKSALATRRHGDQGHMPCRGTGFLSAAGYAHLILE